MSKKLLLVIWPYKFREFDWYRLELSKLEKEYNVDVKVHEQVDFLFPHFTKAFMNFSEDQRITKYKSFKKWKEDFRKIVKENKSRILVINFNSNDSLLSFLVNFELKKSKVKVLKYSDIDCPQEPIDFDLLYFFKSFYSLIKNIKSFKFFLSNYFFTFLGNIFNALPTHSIKNGSELSPYYSYKKNMIIIEGNSHDYDMYLSAKKNNSNSFKEKYALFLEAPTPRFIGDGALSYKKRDEFGTSENWFPSLRRFFDNLEDLLKLKIKIAPHPKVTHEQFPKYYGGREVINQRLAKAAEHANVLITRDSGGLSFAALYKKPALMICSKEMSTNIKFRKQQNHFARELNLNPINIDDPFDSKKILDYMIFDKKKYDEYINKYVTLRKDEKPNYKIIGDLLTSN